MSKHRSYTAQLHYEASSKIERLHAELQILDWIFYQVCVSQHEYLQTELSQSPRV